MKEVKLCVDNSIEMSGGQHGQGTFINPEESIIRFSKHQKQHDVMKQNLLQTGSISGVPFLVPPKLLTKQIGKRRESKKEQKEK